MSVMNLLSYKDTEKASINFCATHVAKRLLDIYLRVKNIKDKCWTFFIYKNIIHI